MNARSVTSCIGASAVSGWPATIAAGSSAGPAGRSGGAFNPERSTSGLLFLAFGLALGFGIGLFGLLLQDALEDFRHVLDAFKNAARDEDRPFLLQGEHDRIAGPRIEFDDFFRDLVIHPQED